MLVAGVSMVSPGSATAQLVPCDAVDAGGNVNAPGGCIARTLQDQVGPGQGDINTFGSSIYLIKRDPARAVRRGRQLFQRKFSIDEGNGPRVNSSSSGDITQSRALGAGLADSCAACHGRPRGSAGFGGDVNTFPDSRDSPHLFGLGLQEMLADEMTTKLRKIRQEAIDEAAYTYSSVTRNLKAKGIKFGKITAFPNGSVDTSQVEGVDANLRIKPFFAEGGTISMREFLIGAFNAEMGLQAVDPILCAVTDPGSPQAMTSPSGFYFDPALDTFERPPVCDTAADPDGDGVANEIDAALVDFMEFYLLNYFKPGQYLVTQRAEKGLELMHDIGCTTCHVQDLKVKNDRRVADVETNFDPVNGIFNELFAVAETRFMVVPDGDPFPQVLPEEKKFVVRNIFTDFKRHDLGPDFDERDFDGTVITEHITEPLWGVGSTAPYGHDGRSINLDSVIRRHGGEAASVTAAYAALSDNNQRKIIEFLQTLVLFPPDDTASSLPGGGGNPGTGNPQDPAEHGFINLGALFQIPNGTIGVE
ncbi:MAG: di-heme oxidoredictase family protein [Acidobacteriota bacterium]